MPIYIIEPAEQALLERSRYIIYPKVSKAMTVTLWHQTYTQKEIITHDHGTRTNNHYHLPIYQT